MNEQSRIEALFDEGRLTRDQADALLAALEESAVQAEIPAESAYNNILEETVAAVLPVRQATSGDEPANLKWLRVKVMAGDVRIRVDENIQFPVATDGEVEATEDGARIGQLRQDHEGNFLEKIIDTARVGRVSVAIPRGWAVRLDVAGGEVRIEGGPVAYVSGRVRAGSVTIDETAGINLDVAAGEVRSGLRLLGGNHRIDIKAGTARLKLLRGSNTQVHARSKIGGIKSPELKVRESGMSAEAEGLVTVGAGGEPQSTLSVSTVTGDIRLEASNE